jgi:hypothetical protein
MKLQLAATILLSLFAGIAVADPPKSDPTKDEVEAAVLKYIDRGMPSPDRTWTGKDFSAAVNVVREKNGLPIPRKGNPLTGVIFGRMVDPTNFDILKAKNIPLVKRSEMVNEYLRGIVDLMMAYLDPNVIVQPYSAELLPLEAYVLHVSEVAFDLAEEAVRGRTEKELVDQADAFKKMRAGLATSISGVLETLTETKQYRDKDLEEFAKQMLVRIPPLWPRMERTVQREYLLRLKKTAETHPNPRIAKTLGELVDVLTEESKKG